jgi:hypothetical protein
MVDNQKAQSVEFENEKYAYEILSKEVDWRREKAWKVFSWASTILLGAIGGLVAIANKRDTALPWWPHRILLIFSIIVLTSYASFWVKQNVDIRNYVLEKMKPFEIKLGVRKENEGFKEVKFGYRATILLLATAAIVSVIFLPCLCLPF